MWLSVFRSKQFVFLIGELQAEFTVHAAIIAKQSKALDALINGSMKEAFSGKAIFEDIAEDTFIRFCQFAYTGDYTTPDFIHIPAVELPDIAPPAMSNDTKQAEPVLDVPVSDDPLPDEPVPDEPVRDEPVPDFSFGFGTLGQKRGKRKNRRRVAACGSHSTTSSMIQRQLARCR